MSPIHIALLSLVSVFGGAALGMFVRAVLPQDHLSADTKDTVKLAMGLVATMTALVLGLLVASAKGSYDAQRNQLIQMAAKFAFLDRVLANCGPDAPSKNCRHKPTHSVRRSPRPCRSPLNLARCIGCFSSKQARPFPSRS